jgi:hypothetical protein
MPELFSEMDVSEWIDSLQLWTTLRGPMLRRSFGFFTAIFDSMLSVDSCILIRFLWCFSVFLRCSDASFCICFSFLISLRSCSCFRMMPRCFFFRRDASSIFPVSMSCLKPHDFHTFYPSLARYGSNTHLSLPPATNTQKKSFLNTSTTALKLSHFDPRYSLLLDLQPYKFDFGPVQEGLLPYLNYSLQLLNLGVFVFDELIDLEGTECNKHVVIERTHNKNIVTILLFQ